ncbi:MAG: outer membrane beta-barrel protein [Alistipes sp.]|nr:outer membrane beta-barrel protein [Alistipes sp.]
MKRLLVALIATFILIPTTNTLSAQEEGDFRFGFRTGYYFGAKAYGIGVYGNYGITDWLNIEPGVNYVAKEKSLFDIYCDFQIPLEIATYWHIYPIIGISANDISENSGAIDGWAGGVNAGLGLSYEINDRWSVNAQGKYMWRFPTEHSSAVIVHIGIDYNF